MCSLHPDRTRGVPEAHRGGRRELILKESIRVNDDHDEIDKSFIDSTVQEKNITFPTDAKLTKKIINRCLKINAKLGLPMRQSY